MSPTSNAVRIKPAEPPYDPEIALDLEKLMPMGAEPLRIFRTVARHPRLLRKFRIGAPLYFRNPLLDPADREIVIHRVCARCKAEYEWGVHVIFFARPLGCSEDWIRATVHASWDDPIWSERESLLVRAVDELHDTATISDALWESLSRNWDESQLLELLSLVGQYHLISFLTNAARIEPEEWAERFPAKA